MNKELSREISYKIVAKKQKQCDILRSAFAKFVMAEYQKQTPRTIKTCLKKYPDWIRTTNAVKLDGFGFRWEQVGIGKEVVCNHFADANLKLDKENSATAMDLKRKWEKARDEIKQLRLEIETALNGLRSFRQIQEHLPEAVKFLPKSTSREVMVNMDSLRNKIQQAI